MPTKPKVKAKTSFAYRTSKLIEVAKNVSASMRVSRYFKGEWVGCPTSQDQLDQAIVNCDQAYVASLKGGVDAKAAKEISEEALKREMTTVVHFVSMKACGDEQILRESGFPLTTITPKASPGSTVPPVVRLIMKHGGIEGLLLASWSRVSGNCSYRLMACTGDPSNEANWWEVTIVGNANNIKVPNCEPGKRYYFKIQVIAPDGTRGSWSQIVTIIAV